MSLCNYLLLGNVHKICRWKEKLKKKKKILKEVVSIFLSGFEPASTTLNEILSIQSNQTM